MENNIIYELSELEKKWWTSQVKIFRKKYIKEPKNYTDHALTQFNIVKELEENDIETAIKKLRSSSWEKYILDENEFHKQVINYLMENRTDVRDILQDVTKSESLHTELPSSLKNGDLSVISSMFGEITSRIMPYIYILTLSTTNSRRARSGVTFETLIETLFDHYKYPYNNQSQIGTKFYADNNISKKVDMIVPSKENYMSNRTHCVVVSMKTSLRERWQEVVEEISRSNLPNIFLITLDEKISSNIAQTLQQYNITLVVNDSIKNRLFDSRDNVVGFKKFFLEEIPHCIDYWQRK